MNVTNDPFGSVEVERTVTSGGAVKDVLPLTTTETKLGLASVDSGASVMVLVIVLVKDTRAEVLGAADATCLEGLVADALVDSTAALVFTVLDRVC